MKLYYKPGACSLASHIVLQEIGADFEIEAVDTAVGKTETGADYAAINPKRYVPALQFADSNVLTEGPAILQFLADSHPETGLSPSLGSMERARMHEQLTYVSSEMHKAFGPLFREGSTDQEKGRAKENVGRTFDTVESLLSDGRETVVPDCFSIADAYLFVVANWANFTGIDLDKWPNLSAFVNRTAKRPAVQRALEAEGLLQ